MPNQSDETTLHNKVATAIAKHVVKFTPQLFSVKNHQTKLPPSPDSSSVLIKVGDRHILITAAHNLHNENLQNIGFMLKKDFVVIGGELRYFEPNEIDGYEPTKKDIAFFELDNVTIEAFKEKYEFLEWNQLGLNHFSSIDSKYIILGYPGERTKKNFPTKLITPTSLTLRTVGLPPPCYYENNIDMTQTLILPVDQNNFSSTETLKKLPNLGGLSGCGVWHIWDTSRTNLKYELVSIITGENELKTLLYSTKIDELLKYLPLYE